MIYNNISKSLKSQNKKTKMRQLHLFKKYNIEKIIFLKIKKII